MNNKIITVIKREYITRVKTKGFIASILLMPVMMFIMAVLPSLMMTTQRKSEKMKTFIVIDETGEIFSEMQEAIAADNFFQHKGKPVYQLTQRESDFKGNLEAKKQLNRQLESKKIQGYIEIPEDVFENRRVNYYAKSITDFERQRAFRNIISGIVTNTRITEKGYSAQEVRDLMRRVHLKGHVVGEDKVQDETTAGVKLIIGYALIFLLYHLISQLTKMDAHIQLIVQFRLLANGYAAG